MKNNYIINLDNYNLKLALTCRSGISFDPGKFGNNQIKQETIYLENCKNELFNFVKNENEIDLYNKTMDYFIAKYIDKLNEMNSAQSRCVSSMIAGPARFKPNYKANSSYEKRVGEIIEIFGITKSYFLKELKKLRTIEAGGEIAVKQNELDILLKRQENMKAINKICMSSKKTNQEKLNECKLLNVSETLLNEIEKTFGNDFEKTKPFASFSLTNLNNKIKDRQAFIARQEKISDRIDSGEKQTTLGQYNGGEIIQDLEAQRINILFDGKPEQEIINKVKSHGFKWSFTCKVWTRKLTNNTLFTVKQMLKEGTI